MKRTHWILISMSLIIALFTLDSSGWGGGRGNGGGRGGFRGGGGGFYHGFVAPTDGVEDLGPTLPTIHVRYCRRKPLLLT